MALTLNKEPNMKLNKIAASLAFIALSISSAAQANTVYSMGTLTTGFSVMTAANAFGTTFTDTFNFNITATSDVSASVADLTQYLYTFTVLKDNNLLMSLNGGAQVGNNISTAMLNLTAGSYSAIVTGNAVGIAGGLYSVAMTAKPSAVPVPAAVWLLGSGLLGLVGIARRKEVA